MNDALRAALGDTGHTIESLAEQVGVDPKTVARWVNEDRIPHPRHRELAAGALRRPIGDIWPDTARRRDLIWFRPWQEIEREAVALRSYQSVVLPGLLQTEAYARAVLAGSDVIARGDVERHLASRLARQGILSRDDPPLFTAVVDEAVLRRPVGGRATMREQLQALLVACEAPHVRMHIVPSSVGAYAGLNGPFVIAVGPEHRTAGYLDNQLQGQVVTDAEDVAAILTAWENVRGEALSHWQSVDLLTEVAKTWN
ncbi:helix-turn-helix transcriptional regulator [Micromonospora sp. NPDC049301]|uniref:helix-turn-helix domain-containing protein n=1 Tax=Micromonospora sp. NPDC049301 TaxID=3155723 RepID=UPI00343368F4